MKSRKDFGKFFSETDLGDYLEANDLRLESIRLRQQDKLISFRLSSDLLALLKKAALRHHTKYQRLIRSILQDNILNYLRSPRV